MRSGFSSTWETTISLYAITQTPGLECDNGAHRVKAGLKLLLKLLCGKELATRTGVSHMRSECIWTWLLYSICNKNQEFEVGSTQIHHIGKNILNFDCICFPTQTMKNHRFCDWKLIWTKPHVIKFSVRTWYRKCRYWLNKPPCPSVWTMELSCRRSSTSHARISRRVMFALRSLPLIPPTDCTLYWRLCFYATYRDAMSFGWPI
jgi:hypothetical protein